MKYKIVWEANYKTYRNWIGYFLYGISPSFYEATTSPDEAKLKLLRLYESLPDSMVKFKLGYKTLKEFATIQLRHDNSVFIRTNTGQTYIEFKIKQYE